MVKKFRLESLGYEVQLGKHAQQAHGAVWLSKEGTVILSTAVMSQSKDFPGFLPLSVDYREQFSAAGKIPGGYLKREGKSSDKEVLTSRLIDRALRPLFPSYFFNPVQVLSTVYSADKEAHQGTAALLAASLSLVISKIPFIEPVAAVEVGRIEGQWVLDPSYDEAALSDVSIIVAGTKDGVSMVEGSASGISEQELVDVLFMAHERIKTLVAWQEEIAREWSVEKDINYLSSFAWELWAEKITTYFTPERINPIFEVGSDKVTLSKAIEELKADFFIEEKESIENLHGQTAEVEYLLDAIFKDTIAKEVVKRNKRVDGRGFDKVRPISVEVGMLPSVHGSSLFQRGQTQALVSATLGTSKDAQKVDDLLGETVDNSFMLHYNFPAFSVGETKPLRAPGRREIGHGYLAGSAIRRVLPSRQDFPYTIRVISDILECNGSSSMATICGATMSLMHAGVPIKGLVAGVAMGLLEGNTGEFKALTDITGFEDALGLMDFKVAGTEQGINAIQMDIKYKGGLPRKVFEDALEQAREGRLHILGKMKEVMPGPNKELSPLVPRIMTISVDPNKVGGIIGSGGKVIKEIIEKTGTSIDIEGSDVNIFAQPSSDLDTAVSWVKILSGQIERDLKVRGTIVRTADFGLFVDIAPGKSGLLHISKIERSKQKDLAQHYPLGTEVEVVVLDYDKETGKIKLGFAK